MKTILHLIDTSGPGGAETVFMNLQRSFSGGDFRCVPLVTKNGWVQKTLEKDGVQSYTCDAKGSLNTRYLREIIRLVRRERIDLIQGHLSGPNVYASMAGLMTRTPVVSIFHGAVDLESGNRLARVKIAAINAGSSRIVSVSRHLRTHLLNTTSLNGDRLEVIHNGVDLNRFHRSSTDLLRTELSLGPDAFIVCSLGNIRAPKGYEYLIEAAARLRDSDPHIHFVIAGHGGGRLYAQLQEMHQQLDLQRTVHFLGFRNDPVPLLCSADLFLLPSTSEGFSISTIEAMACGLPVVVTRSGGPEEIVTSGVDGRLIPPASSATIAETIQELARDPVERERLGHSASQTVVKRFSLEAMTGSYERLYREILG